MSLILIYASNYGTNQSERDKIKKIAYLILNGFFGYE